MEKDGPWVGVGINLNEELREGNRKGDERDLCHEHLGTISQGRKFWRQFSLGEKRACGLLFSKVWARENKLARVSLHVFSAQPLTPVSFNQIFET